jgi:sugar transferase (PEP-CTERM/EpsH1 system associated)
MRCAADPVRVLFLTHRLPYAANRGDRIRALHILRYLSHHADVDLVSLTHDPDEAGHANDLRDLAASVTLGPVTRFRGYCRVIPALIRRRPLTHALLDAPGLEAAYHQVISRHAPDVVLAFGSGMARFALEPPLNEFPLVLDMIDVDSEKWKTLSHTARAPRRWVYAREASCLSEFEGRAARAAHSVLVVNERERASMARIEPSANIVVIPNGIDVEAFDSPAGPSRERRVVFCGVMNYEPNHDAALWFATTVWPVVRTRVPDARLALVGSNPMARLIKAVAADPTVEVTGAVPDVRPYLWRAAVSVAPLWVARGVQNKVLEAVAARLPCVVTSAVEEGLPPHVLPACLVARDADAFAAAVIDLLEREPAERRAIADRADLRSLQWSARLQRLSGILEEAARNRPCESRPAPARAS